MTVISKPAIQLLQTVLHCYVTDIHAINDVKVTAGQEVVVL